MRKRNKDDILKKERSRDGEKRQRVKPTTVKMMHYVNHNRRESVC